MSFADEGRGVAIVDVELPDRTGGAECSPASVTGLVVLVITLPRELGAGRYVPNVKDLVDRLLASGNLSLG